MKNNKYADGFASGFTVGTLTALFTFADKLYGEDDLLNATVSALLKDMLMTALKTVNGPVTVAPVGTIDVLPKVITNLKGGVSWYVSGIHETYGPALADAVASRLDPLINQVIVRLVHARGYAARVAQEPEAKGQAMGGRMRDRRRTFGGLV